MIGDPTASELLDGIAIRDLVQGWLIYRDKQEWDKFMTLHFEDSVMITTWGGRVGAKEFAEAASRGYAQGDRMLHTAGAIAVEVSGTRAIAQHKAMIMQRGLVEGVLCDVHCLCRPYDFFEKRGGRWGFVLRQPIYERDSIAPVDPNDTVTLKPEKLALYPEGYARLGYLQAGLGHPINPNLPTLTGPLTDALYEQGATWLAGGELHWPPE